jgi:hypothetical protein
MPERALCNLCESRPPRRHCPAVQGEICAVCCGTEREQTLDCPLDCDYLREARRHEKVTTVDPKTLPNPEIEVSDRFLQEQQPLAVVTGRLLLSASLQTPGTVDLDLRDALDSLVRTFKTADSGLIYESRPSNAIAGAVQARFQQELSQFREDIAQRSGVHSVRDKDVLGVLVFWQRMEWQTNNGRRKSRSFLESLYGLLPPPPAEEQPTLHP